MQDLLFRDIMDLSAMGIAFIPAICLQLLTWLQRCRPEMQGSPVTVAFLFYTCLTTSFPSCYPCFYWKKRKLKANSVSMADG